MFKDDSLKASEDIAPKSREILDVSTVGSTTLPPSPSHNTNIYEFRRTCGAISTLVFNNNLQTWHLC